MCASPSRNVVQHKSNLRDWSRQILFDPKRYPPSLVDGGGRKVNEREDDDPEALMQEGTDKFKIKQKYILKKKKEQSKI